MGWKDFFTIGKGDAKQNNYKLNIFNAVSQDNQIANMATVKKYFNKLYDDSHGITSFSVNQSIGLQDDVYVAQATNKIARLTDYRNMAMFDELAQSIDTICYSANIPDENNVLVDVKIVDDQLQNKDKQIIKDAVQDYLNLFDFDNNFEQFFRVFIVQGQLCWQNIVAKDDLQQGIIGINIIPNDSYEFCYDLKNRRKAGIMITNTMADNFNLAESLGTHGGGGNATSVGAAFTSLNCYQQLLEQKCIVLPFDQITYIDTGIYTSDNKQVLSPLQRCKRAFNQLKLIEDAILIYRVSRAPEKYVFNVDIGKMGKARGQMQVSKLMKQFGTKKTYDPNTGTVGKAYDPMQMTQNFWFVKGQDSQGIHVQSLSAQGNWGQLQDLEYFKKKLLRTLNIPAARFFGETGAALVNNPQGISADQLNFAKFIMSLQKRFALGLLNGAMTHLRLTGLWDSYKLTKNKIKIIINPPVEYITYRRQKMLETKLTMLKAAVGDEVASRLFSAQKALQIFMGWDTQKIEQNQKLKFKQALKSAKQQYMIEKVKQTGTIDFKAQDQQGSKTFKQILQKGIELNALGGENDDGQSEDRGGEGGDEFSGEMPDFGGGGQESGGMGGGEQGGGGMGIPDFSAGM